MRETAEVRSLEGREPEVTRFIHARPERASNVTRAVVASAIFALTLLAFGSIPVSVHAAPAGSDPVQCNDGADNDGDGKADHPADPGCHDSTDNSEADGSGRDPAACKDGVDNDGDGATDHPHDPDCVRAIDNSEGTNAGAVPGGGGGGGGQPEEPAAQPLEGNQPLPCTNPTIVGTPGNDFIRGTQGNDVIDGLGGNDRIRGRGGNDVLCGGDNDDYVNGGGGNDHLNGNLGNDFLRGRKGADFLDGGEQFNNNCRTGKGTDPPIFNC